MLKNKGYKDPKYFLYILEIITLAAVMCMALSEFGGYYLIITTIGKHSRLLRKIAFALFLSKILFTRYTKKEFGYVALFSILGYLNYRISGNVRSLFSVLCVLSLKNVELKKVFRVCFFGVLFMVTLLGTLSALGITGVLEITQEYGRGGIETRYCFGFHHPNQWAHAMFMIYLYGVLGFWDKVNWKTALAIFAANCVVFYLSASRTSLICATLLILFILFYKYAGKTFLARIVNWFVIPGVASVWGLAVYVMSDYSLAEKIREKLDPIFTRRLSYAKLYVEKYPPTLFGQQVPDTLKYGQPLDFGYIRFLLENGVMIYLCMAVLTVLLCRYALKRGRQEIVIAIICISLYGIYENIAMKMIPANVVMCLMAALLYRGEDDKQVKKIKREEFT